MEMSFKDATMNVNFLHTILMVVLFFLNISQICDIESNRMLSTLAHFNEGKMENTAL